MRCPVTSAMGFGVAVWAAIARVSADGSEATVRAEVNSAYVARGVTMNRDPVLNPLLDVSLGGGVGAYVWGNFDIGDGGGRLRGGEFSENDIAVYYSRTVGLLAWTAGCIEYVFPGQSLDGGAVPGTRELYTTIEAGMGGGFTTTVGLYWDIDEIMDVYGNVSIAYRKELAACLTGEVAAGIGCVGKDWAAYNSGGTEGGFNEYNASAALSYRMTEALAFGAKVNFTDSLNTDVLPDQETHWFGGIGVEARF